MKFMYSLPSKQLVISISTYMLYINAYKNAGGTYMEQITLVISRARTERLRVTFVYLYF